MTEALTLHALSPIGIEDLADLLTSAHALEFTDHGMTRLYSGTDKDGRHFAAAMNNADGECFISASTAAVLAQFSTPRSA